MLMLRARSLGLLSGVTVGHDVTISHLQFADDTIIFCEAKLEVVMVVKRILRCFELVSGLKINFHKSSICGIGVPESELEEFASRLHCKYRKLPLMYLGLPLGANPRLKKTWQPILDKCKARLASWKRKLLSFGGRLMLIKSVLSNLPTYYLSLFKLPSSVAKAFDKIRPNFLWGGPI